MKVEQQLLATKLEPEEFTAKARALAETHEKLALEREQQKETRADMKKRIEELEQKRNSLARVVQRGKEERLVDVEVQALDDQGIARTVRLDTGEVVALLLELLDPLLHVGAGLLLLLALEGQLLVRLGQRPRLRRELLRLELRRQQLLLDLHHSHVVSLVK
jgi:hypothetical protein